LIFEKQSFKEVSKPFANVNQISSILILKPFRSQSIDL